MFIVKDSDTATAPLVGTRSDWTSVNSFTLPALDTTTIGNNALVLYSAVLDGGSQTVRLETNVGDIVPLVSSNYSNNMSYLIGYRVQRTAGNAPTPTVYPGTSSDGGNAWTLAIKNSTGGSVPAECTTAVSQTILTTGLVGRYRELLSRAGSGFSFTSDSTTDVFTATGHDFSNNDYVVFQAVSATGGVSFGVGRIAVVKNVSGNTFQLAPTSYDAVYNFTSNITGTLAKVPFWLAASAIASTVGGITVSTDQHYLAGAYNADSFLTGAQLAITTPGAFVGNTYVLPSSIDMTDKFVSFDFQNAYTTNAGPKGSVIVFSDGTNWAAFQIANKSALNSSVFENYVIDPNGTTFDSSGTIDWSAVTKIAFLQHRLTGNGSTHYIYFRNLYLLDKSVLLGGGANSPATMGTVLNVFTTNQGSGLLQVQGKSQYLVRHGVQIGDASTPTIFSASASSAENPLSFQIANITRHKWNVANTAIAQTVKASASDTIDFGNSIISSTTFQSFIIDSSSSTSATYNFSGANFIGQSVTWKTGITCDKANFSGCKEIDGKGASFTSCNFSDAVDTNCIKLEAGSSLVGSTFIKGSDTYAVEITEAGEYDFTNTVFTGYTTDINITATTGTVTITLASGQTQPTYTSAGATVVYAQTSATVSIIGLEIGARMQVYNVTTDEEIYNDVLASTSYTESYIDGTTYTSGDTVRVRIQLFEGDTASKFFERNAIVSEGGWSMLVSLENDAVYETNAVDGSTIDYITITDGTLLVGVDAGTVTWQDIYAYNVYWLSTEEGIRDEGSFIDAPDTANYKFYDFKIKNITDPAVPLYISGGYGVRGETGSPINLFDDTGWSIFPVVPHVVPVTVNGSVVVEQGATPAEMASAVWSDTVTYADGTKGSMAETVEDIFVK
jgi:hypothetical protein